MSKSRLRQTPIRIMEAQRTVGTTAADRVEWLAEFAGRDLADDGALVASAWELLAFCLARGPAGPRHYPITDDADGERPAFDVLAIHRTLRRCLSALRDRGDFDLPISLERLSLTYDPRVGCRLGIHQGGSSVFFLVLLELFTAAGARIKFCSRAGCGRMFFAVRPHQRHCSRRCKNAVAVARWRKENPTRAADARHERHARKQRDKHERPGGPKIKVTRRRRPR